MIERNKILTICLVCFGAFFNGRFLSSILQIRDLKAKLNGEINGESKGWVKEEGMELESNEQGNDSKPTSNELELNFDPAVAAAAAVAVPADFKDGSSDSDSSVILNEETSSYHSSEAFLISHEPFPDCFKFSERFKPATTVLGDTTVHKLAYQPPLQFVKIEEHFSSEESCSTLFSDEQAPTLHWY